MTKCTMFKQETYKWSRLLITATEWCENIQSRFTEQDIRISNGTGNIPSVDKNTISCFVTLKANCECVGQFCKKVNNQNSISKIVPLLVVANNSSAEDKRPKRSVFPKCFIHVQMV